MLALGRPAAADDFLLDRSRPACGKVCKLVCEKKKLTAICYGCECKEICIPAASRQGCKHCATCYGDCTAEDCSDCQDHPPKCEFCWRDWFACGCAKPRTVKVLTKYQAEKEICWYHWEVVDAACCDCVSKNSATLPGEKNAGGPIGSDQTADARCLYKAAPEDAELGDVLPVSEEEWVKLVAVLTPDQNADAVQVAERPTTDQTGGSAEAHPAPQATSEEISVAEKLRRLLRR